MMLAALFHHFAWVKEHVAGQHPIFRSRVAQCLARHGHLLRLDAKWLLDHNASSSGMEVREPVAFLARRAPRRCCIVPEPLCTRSHQHDCSLATAGAVPPAMLQPCGHTCRRSDLAAVVPTRLHAC